MDIFAWIGLIVSSLVSLGSLAGVIVALKKVPHETKQTDAQTASIDAQTESTDAETARKYLDIANLAAERALKLDERVKCLEKENADLRKSLRDMQITIDDSVVERNSLKDWATRLTHQVISLNGKPVEYKTLPLPKS